MTERDYRSADGISRTELWKIRESPEKFKWAQEHPEEPTPALIFGTLVHKVLLEPKTVDEEFVIAPDVDRRTKDGKEAYSRFMANVGDRTIVSQTDFNKASEMVNALNALEFVEKLLDGDREMPIRWYDDLTEELCKCRLDCLTYIDDKPIVVDYKTAADASTDAFVRSAINHGYDFQAGMYCEGIEKITGLKPVFVFIVQEKDPPYAVNIFQADDLMVKRGYDIFRELIGIYHDCKQTGNWYGYLGKYNVINNLALPAWLAKEVE